MSQPASASSAAGPLLAGVRVVEFTEYVAGPFAGRMLADLGADVIKVDPVGGDPWRRYQAVNETEGRAYIASNRGKRCLALDLGSPGARNVIERLAKHADVVLVNLRTDSVQRLGIDWERLSGLNPRLIYGEITAFGQSGPLREQAGYDLLGLAASGVLAAEGKIHDGVPATLTFPTGDCAAGSTLVGGVCAALYRRERTGRGERVSTSLLGALSAVQSYRITFVGEEDEAARVQLVEELDLLRESGAAWEKVYGHYSKSRPTLEPNVYYRAYQTADGHVVLAALNDRQRGLIMGVLGIDDPRWRDGAMRELPPGADLEALVRRAEAVMRTRTSAEWMAEFQAIKVPITPVIFPEELPTDPQAVATGLFVNLDHPRLGEIRTPGGVIETSCPTPPLSTPGIGEHTDEVLAALGYGEEEVQALRDAHVVG